MRFLLRPSVRIFLAVQGMLYLSFLYLDVARGGNGSVGPKYLSIALCLLTSVYWSAGGGDRLVTAGLLFTLGADTFLLLLDYGYGLGVLLFCVVQGLYLARICRESGGRPLWAARLGLFLAALLMLGRLGLLSGLNVLALFYFSNFLCNAIQSLPLPGPRNRMFSAGLVLFLCCDVCVAVFNQGGIVPRAWYDFARVGMWLFYLPAQVLITLSGLPERDTGRDSV